MACSNWNVGKTYAYSWYMAVEFALGNWLGLTYVNDHLILGLSQILLLSTYTSFRNKNTNKTLLKSTLLLKIECQDTHIYMKTEGLQTKWDAAFLGGKGKIELS